MKYRHAVTKMRDIRIRSFAFSIAVALLVTASAPSAAIYSDGVDLESHEGLPPSRPYIDLETYLIYNYDNVTGALTPTFLTGNPADFVCVDAYDALSPSSCAVSSYYPGAGDCTSASKCLATCTGYQACITATIAVVGDHDLVASGILTRACMGPFHTGENNTGDPARQVVSHLRWTAGAFRACGPGSFQITTFRDGALVGFDSINYQ